MSVQEKFEKFWETESFETKTTNDIVYDNFYNNIPFNEGESRYQVSLPPPLKMIMTYYQIIITIANPD